MFDYSCTPLLRRTSHLCSVHFWIRIPLRHTPNPAPRCLGWSEYHFLSFEASVVINTPNIGREVLNIFFSSYKSRNLGASVWLFAFLLCRDFHPMTSRVAGVFCGPKGSAFVAFGGNMDTDTFRINKLVITTEQHESEAARFMRQGLYAPRTDTGTSDTNNTGLLRAILLIR